MAGKSPSGALLSFHLPLLNLLHGLSLSENPKSFLSISWARVGPSFPIFPQILTHRQSCEKEGEVHWAACGADTPPVWVVAWSKSRTIASSLNLPWKKVTLLFCCLCLTDGCKGNCPIVIGRDPGKRDPKACRTLIAAV